jgi:hypothetical protein
MPPWPMDGQVPQQIGMQPGVAASPPQQQGQQSGAASPTASDAPNAVYPTSPMWTASGSFPPQFGQQFPNGTPTFSPQMGMYGLPLWAMAGPPVMPMSPNMTSSDLPQAPQTTMYQQNMQAVPWQFDPTGVTGWPAMASRLTSMYSMYPIAHPGFPSSPPVPIATAFPTSEGSESPSAAAMPPPYSEPISNKKLQRSQGISNTGDVPPFHILLLT